MTASLPKKPLAAKPGGYLGLANYSSLGTFWRYLRGAGAAGRTVGLVRGDDPDTCRRRISGYTVPGAGFLLDSARLQRELEHDFVPHPAVLAFLGGDPAPLREELNAHYALHTDFVLALTAGRELIVRPEFVFRPAADGAGTLPPTLRLYGRRMSRDEIGVLLSRACGL
ncbi:hypothetical protein GCM10017783_06650 [Deinococcus piscis]|uniref:Uncharacterized protein n=1 Tax=Deinococcus piscis TaxID=394230 RepID=A0ABQ3K6B9_9DEIO|nr:hypothetical protein [Deinococcus piscis]GHF97453.1 hypothetical protein GCM10017783_06650 [Deinococcus piscis]